jgi:hypothetical protein
MFPGLEEALGIVGRESISSYCTGHRLLYKQSNVIEEPNC